MIIKRELDEGDISHPRLLFTEDQFIAPSYFEFDEYNEVILTFCSPKKYGDHIPLRD